MPQLGQKPRSRLNLALQLLQYRLRSGTEGSAIRDCKGSRVGTGGSVISPAPSAWRLLLRDPRVLRPLRAEPVRPESDDEPVPEVPVAEPRRDAVEAPVAAPAPTPVVSRVFAYGRPTAVLTDAVHDLAGATGPRTSFFCQWCYLGVQVFRCSGVRASLFLRSPRERQGQSLFVIGYQGRRLLQ